MYDVRVMLLSYRCHERGMDGVLCSRSVSMQLHGTSLPHLGPAGSRISNGIILKERQKGNKKRERNIKGPGSQDESGRVTSRGPRMVQ
jgi:hypothetical protein